MTRAELVGERILCDVPYRETALIKRVPGMKWKQDLLRWSGPLSWATCQGLRGVFGDALEIGPELTTWAWGEYETRIVPALGWRANAMDPHCVAGSMDGNLYPYQENAVHFLVHAESALLADEMGTGKTPTVISAVQAWPLLVVCPKSVTHNWAREIEKWSGVRAIVLEGTASQRAKWFAEFERVGADGRAALVVNYETLRAHSRLAPYGSIALTDKEKVPGLLNSVEWGTVIADEAHRVKDPRAKQTRALWAVGDRAAHRYALTGTPIANNIVDLWSVMRFVSPEEWPSKTAFIERYCIASLSHWGGMEIHGLNPTTRAEFDRIFEPRYLRRTKSMVLKSLPPKVHLSREVELPPRLRRAYNEMAEGMVAILSDGSTVASFDVLGAALRLKQMASSAMQEIGEGVYRMCEPSPKLDALEELLDDLGDEPCPIFTSSRQLLDLACARLDKAKISYATLVGGQPGWERQDAIDSYNNGKVRCLLVSTGAGSEGFSLVRGSHAIFLDRPWSAVQSQQAEDRLHGTGRGAVGATSITYHDLVTQNTIEQHVFEVLGNKAENLEDLTRDRARLLEALRVDR